MFEEEDDDFEDLDDLLEDEEEAGEVVDTPIIDAKLPTSSKTPKGIRINLFFRSTIGVEKIEKLTVDSEMPVRDLAATIGQIFALDPQDFHLSISGRTMDPDDVLSNYDLEDGLECLIIPVSTAG